MTEPFVTPGCAPEDTERAGGTRFSKGKPGGWWYAPIYGLRLVAPVWQQGADKYAPFDWSEGQSYSTLIDCVMRHLLEVVDKGVWSRDPESGNLHLAHCAWNVLCLLTFMARDEREDVRAYDEALNDIDPWRGVTAAMKRELDE